MDVSTAEWASSDTDAASAQEAVPFGTSIAAASGTDDSPTLQLSQSSQRTFLHRVYRLFKFVTIVLALLLLVAQVVSVVFLPFDGVELIIKIFLCSFSVLIVLNELEWWGMLQGSPLLGNWITRGYFYAFIGMVSLEENNVKPAQSLNTLAVDYTAALFIETASWMIFVVGALYFALGLCCGQRYLNKVRKDYADRLAERRRIFEEGLCSDAALSRQMVT